MRKAVWWRPVCLLGFALWAWGIGILVEAAYCQCVMGGPLESDLGFRHGSPYVRLDGREQEVFTLESVVPGGVFAKAGFQPGDIVRDLSITGFYKLLCRNRGKEAFASSRAVMDRRSRSGTLDGSRS